MKVVIAAALAFLITSCTVQKDLVPTGGSRADGTVNLSYEYGLFEKPQVDLPKATAVAMQRCAAWGYTGAEPFGGQMNKCEAFDGYGDCTRTLVTVTYQCTGTPGASK
jgi:hypothetical protein